MKVPSRQSRSWQSEPSLAGVAVTRGLKRRQGLHEVRVVSHEIDKLAKAQRVPYREGSMCAADVQGGDASPGLLTASRANGRRRKPGGPAGATSGTMVGAMCEG